MTEPSHPLDRPLPPDVAAGDSAFIHFYQKYAAFSWPWALRRTLLFGSLGAVAGASIGVSHGLFVRNLWQGVIVSLAFAFSNLVLLGAGPLLAAFFRHRDWPLRAQRVLIVIAVLFGMAAAVLADDWAQKIHNGFMTEHGSHSENVTEPVSDTYMFMRRAMDAGRDLLILFICSGGLALPGYFTERKRWAEHARRVALEKLSVQKSEADTKLTLLQAQVEPHFLFNTLASVRSLVASDPARAAQTIEALTKYLRATLPRLRAETGTPQSTLAEQFAICSSYLELMQVRLGGRLVIDLHLPADLADVPFPPLLLISLVENAIKHGVEPKPGATHVRLAARTLTLGDQPQLEVSVEDDGAGLKLGMGEGTGLANIRAQLLTRFGMAATLELQQRGFGGVLARLVVPLEARAP